MEKIEHIGFLIPEFISLTGLNEEQRSDYYFMKKVTPYIKLAPEERMKENTKVINILNRSDKLDVKEPYRVTNYQLEAPRIKVGNDRDLRGHDEGYFTLREKVRQPVELKNWILVYSEGANPKDDEKTAANFLDQLHFVRKSLGISVL